MKAMETTLYAIQFLRRMSVCPTNKMNCELMLTYDTPTLRQTGSRNLTGQKCFPQYGVPIWSLWPNIRFLPSIVAEKKFKCDEKWAYTCMFNVYKNQQSRQTGSRNLMGPKTLPTIWGTDMKLVTKYQICVINSFWEKCAYMFNVYYQRL